MNDHQRITALKKIIHDQKKELVRLGDMEKLLDTFIDSVAGIHWWKDKRGIYRGCNQAMVEQLGLTCKSDIIGKNDYELAWSAQAEELIANDTEVMKTRAIQRNKEEIVTTPDGITRTFLVTKAPFFNTRGQIIGTVGNSMDITEIKRLEQALREAKEAAETADQAKTAFLENIRHDLRTPLVGIIGCAEAIKGNLHNPEKSEDVMEYADSLVASSDALSSLLNQVLEIIKVTSGEMPLQKKKFDLKEKLLQIIQFNEARAKQKQLDLSLDYDPKIPAYLIGDPIRIQRLVLELITNALNFTDQGFIKIKTLLAKRREKDCVIKISIQDTGIGIAPDQQQAIFTRFKRLTPSYQGIYPGAGLGLTLVKQLIDDLDGEIYVESNSQGSVFTCVLPCKTALLNESLGIDCAELKLRSEMFPSLKKSAGYIVKSNKSSGLIHVLLVEDLIIAAKLSKLLLTDLNCSVDIAMDGESALQFVKCNPYQLVILDIGLPDISGNEVARKIREWEKSQVKQIPIVALTAHVENEKQEECIQAGIDLVLSKPLLKQTAHDMLNKFFPECFSSSILNNNTIKNRVDSNWPTRLGFNSE